MTRALPAVVAALLLAVPASAAAAGPTAEELARAEVLFQQARGLMAERRFVEACARFAESLQLDPGAGGTMLNLALCYEAGGQPLQAWRTFRAALTAAKRDGRRDREREASTWLSALDKQVGSIAVEVPAASRREGLAVRVDGELVLPAYWGDREAVPPGGHVVTATAPGHKPWQVTVTVATGQRVRVAVPALEAEGTAGGGRPSATPGGDGPMVHARAPAPSAFGAMVRVDIEGFGHGAVAAPGLTYAIRRRVELGVAALLGAKQGLWAGGTLFLLRGSWAPRVTVGMPLFFKDGARPGVQASGGLEWRIVTRVAVFVDLGVAYFPSVPADYRKTIFLPAVGVVGRLY
jgi:hypothetical protein